MLKIVEKFKISAAISLAIIIVGAVVFGIFGFAQDVDFVGGLTMTINVGDKNIDHGELEQFIKDNTPNGVEPTIQSADDKQIIVKTTPIDNVEDRDKLKAAILEKYELDKDAIPQFENVDASVGKELKTQALTATLIAAVLMLVYIAIRFDMRTGIAAVICLLHDVLIMLTVYAVFRIPVSSNFIAAILTIVGYSINNTIVVFDRIRENYAKNKKASFAEIVNTSIKQTLGRSISTTITTLLPVIMLFIFGVTSIRQFTIPLMVGLLAGTYSSVLLAGPLWVMMKNLQANRKKKKLAQR